MLAVVAIVGSGDGADGSVDDGATVSIGGSTGSLAVVVVTFALGVIVAEACTDGEVVVEDPTRTMTNAITKPTATTAIAASHTSRRALDTVSELAGAGGGDGAMAAACRAASCARRCALGSVIIGGVIAISTAGSGLGVSKRAGSDFGPP